MKRQTLFRERRLASDLAEAASSPGSFGVRPGTADKIRSVAEPEPGPGFDACWPVRSSPTSGGVSERQKLFSTDHRSKEPHGCRTFAVRDRELRFAAIRKVASIRVYTSIDPASSEIAYERWRAGDKPRIIPKQTKGNLMAGWSRSVRRRVRSLPLSRGRDTSRTSFNRATDPCASRFGFQPFVYGRPSTRIYDSASRDFTPATVQGRDEIFTYSRETYDRQLRRSFEQETTLRDALVNSKTDHGRSGDAGHIGR